MIRSGLKLVHHLLEQSTRLRPDKIALVHGEDRLTYRQINSGANRLARSLVSAGVRAGDRVALLLENSKEYVVSYYGVLKTGAVAVPLSSESKKENLAPLLAEVEPVAIIGSDRHEAALKEMDLLAVGVKVLVVRRPLAAWGRGALQAFAWEDLAAGSDDVDLDLPLEDSGLASIIYTSGSTGKPKGVMLSHANIVSNVHSITEYLELTDKDIQMVVLPFFYVMGKSLLNTHVAVGGTVVINNRGAFSAMVIRQMIQEGVTGFSGVPSTYAYLLHQSPLRARRSQLETLRYCSQAGGHLSRTMKEELLQALPEHTRLFVMYGATEASARLAYVEPSRLVDKIDSIGRPIPGVSLKVLDARGRELPVGEVGELVAAGDNIMAGYWRDPESTARALSSHGYHTGDLGYRDADGYFYLVGRSDSLLKVGGHRINPQEVEEALMASGLLIEAAVLGVPDAMLGHRLAALLVPRVSGMRVKDLLRDCLNRLPGYKIPGEVSVVKSLPKNLNGKVDRAACLRILSEREAPKDRTESDHQGVA